MNILITAFWFLIILVVYTYIGYGIVLFVLVKIKGFFINKEKIEEDVCLGITVLIAAFNEELFIKEKIENTLQLNYPEHNLKVLIVTDGSVDGTTSIVKEYPQITLLHQDQRRGKIAAVSRAMKVVNTGIVVFTDANTFLNPDALLKLVSHFQNPKVGAVAGEKRILTQNKDMASASGEGFYWKYESKLKSWDSELHTVVGAAGELFAIRTKLFEEMPDDTLIEDFYLTLKIAQKGFKVVYEPEAYAIEEPSASSAEELKRKIRIAAGGIQSISRLLPLLNVFKYSWLSFQYFSHRVLRWTLAPLALPFIFLTNAFLAYKTGSFYTIIFIGQLAFYLMAFIGFIFEKKKIKFKLFFVPYYFCMMNYAVFLGFLRFLKGSQSVLWERAERRSD